MTAEGVGQGAPTGTEEYIATGGTSGTRPYRLCAGSEVATTSWAERATGRHRSPRSAASLPLLKDVASDLGIERGQDLATFEAEAWLAIT
jgi:hypothetical protein